MLRFTQFYLLNIRPKVNALLTRLFYSNKRVKFGKGLKVDGIPRIIINKGCFLSLGVNVQLKRNVEIRCHKQSRIHIGDNVKLDRGVRILVTNESKIEIRNGARIGLYTVLNGGDNIEVGAKSLISGFVYLQTSMHSFKESNTDIQDQGYTHLPIELSADTWLGTHVVIMPGVKVGRGAVVGSNAVVNKNVEEYHVVAGVPAKPIGSRL